MFNRRPACLGATGQDRFRIRRSRYRILYTIQEQELIIVKITHRKDAYR